MERHREADDDSGPGLYFSQLKTQPVIVAMAGPAVAGFMAFVHRHESSLLPEGGRCNYISTVLTGEDWRGRGVCSGLYDYMLFRLDQSLRTPWLMTRTWSSNHGHIKVLEKYGFNVLRQLADDRGPGIDTIYFYRRDTLSQLAES